MNPLKILILASAKKANMSRHYLAIVCGYQNIDKGLRKIDNYVESLIDTNYISAKLQLVLAIPVKEYQFAVLMQRERLTEASRQSFKQCTQVVFSSDVTSPVFAAQFFLNIPVPPFIYTLNFDDKMKHIFELYKADQLSRFASTKYVKDPKNYQLYVQNLEVADRNGELYFYGIGKGYRYHKNYDESYTFNRYGKLVLKSLQAPKSAALVVNGKDIFGIIN